MVRTRPFSLEGIAALAESDAFGAWRVDSFTCSPRLRVYSEDNVPRRESEGGLVVAELAKAVEPPADDGIIGQQRPQVCMSPPLIDANLYPPATFVGAARVVVVLSPT